MTLKYNVLTINKCMCSLYFFNADLILVAGLLQVSPDELVSALTTDIQYFKGKLYCTLTFTSVQVVVIFKVRAVNAALPFRTSRNSSSGPNAKREKHYESICSLAMTAL